MLWRKSWIESRHLLAIGLLSVILQFVLINPARPMKSGPARRAGLFAMSERDAVRLAEDYEARVWVMWISRVATFFCTFTAVFYAANGVVVNWCKGSTASYSLSLPVRRRRLLAVRATVGGMEHAATAVVAGLLLPLGSALAGRHYPVAGGLLYGIQLAAGGLAFYGVAVLLEALVRDSWQRVLPYAVFSAAGLAGMGGERTFLSPVFRIMTGRVYQESGIVPWGPMALLAAAGIAAIALGAFVVERREF